MKQGAVDQEAARGSAPEPPASPGTSRWQGLSRLLSEGATRPTVTIGIINHNGETYLPDTLAAIAGVVNAADEVLLIDSGSSDEGLAFAKRHYPAVRIVELGSNLGPSVARNTAVRLARHERVLLVDNDAAPQPGCIEALAAALDAHPNAAVAMPTVLYSSSPDTIQYLGAQPHYLGTQKLLCADSPLSEIDPTIRVVGSVISCCLMLDRSRFDEPVRFDEHFFFHFEDHEFGLRTTLSGRDCLVVPQARCLHGEGTLGLSIRQTGRFTPVRVRYTIRNRWLTLLSLYQGSTLLRFAPALIAFEVFQFFGSLARGWGRHWFWALGSAANSWRHVRHARAHMKTRRLRNDLDVLVNGPFPYNKITHRSALARMMQRTLDAIATLNWQVAAVGRDDKRL